MLRTVADTIIAVFIVLIVATGIAGLVFKRVGKAVFENALGRIWQQITAPARSAEDAAKAAERRATVQRQVLLDLQTALSTLVMLIQRREQTALARTRLNDLRVQLDDDLLRGLIEQVEHACDGLAAAGNQEAWETQAEQIIPSVRHANERLGAVLRSM